MSNRLMIASMAAVLGLAGSVLATDASACAFQNFSMVAAAQGANPAAQAAALLDLSGLGSVHTNAMAEGVGHGSIVGMWSFTFTAPDGITNVDWGFQQWHSDGTELTNSGGQLPATGNFCMGTWAQKGDGQYRLNHWAIAWALPGTDPSNLIGLINIREVVGVDHDGNKMTGTFSLDLYDKTGATHIAHLVDGAVAGTRITP
jgi:hypothetical protein